MDHIRFVNVPTMVITDGQYTQTATSKDWLPSGTGFVDVDNETASELITQIIMEAWTRLAVEPEDAMLVESGILSDLLAGIPSSKPLDDWQARLRALAGEGK